LAFETSVRAASGPPVAAWLSLTGEFGLRVADRRIVIPHSVERVLAYLALSNRPVSRTRLAGVLWLDASDHRAANNLRTALWRLNRFGAHLVIAEDDRLILAPDVSVDVTELSVLTRRLIDAPDDETLAALPLLIGGAELLPDWDDEWVVADRERFRLLRLEALERAADALISRMELGRALDAALGAAQSEPLRESARRLLIRVHLADGNVAEALREYRGYEAMVMEEIGLEPSVAMQELIRPYEDTRLVTVK
jgi:DNA-binding SARP family transcriptional activator